MKGVIHVIGDVCLALSSLFVFARIETFRKLMPSGPGLLKQESGLSLPTYAVSACRLLIHVKLRDHRHLIESAAAKCGAGSLNVSHHGGHIFEYPESNELASAHWT